MNVENRLDFNFQAGLFFRFIDCSSEEIILILNISAWGSPQPFARVPGSFAQKHLVGLYDQQTDYRGWVFEMDKPAAGTNRPETVINLLYC